MLKKCKDCGSNLGKDKKTGKYWCVGCRDIKDDFIERYKICVLGKNTGVERGHSNFIKKMAVEWRKMGHEVIEIKFAELYNYIPMWDLTDSFVNKKPIPLRFIDHIHSPDIIYIEQTYNRFDVSDINATVIYQHREYTHFPDIVNPDILFGSYPKRLDFFEFYHPYEYSKIPYTDYVYVAADPSEFTPSKKRFIAGITMLGWSLPPINFANANGIVARMVIEDQVAFYTECEMKCYLQYMDGGTLDRYKELLKNCEAVLIDGGYINSFGRRLFEAALTKTLMIVRVHSDISRDIFKEIGLTDEMCHFVYSPDDLESIINNWDIKDNDMKIEKAYEWVINNHTYEIRARQALEKYEEYLSGKRTINRFMGYSMHSDIAIDGGKLIHSEII